MRADTDLTNRNLLMASSYYHFFQARKSGKFYVKVDVENLSASGAKQVTSYLFKEADLNPLIYQTKK